NRARLARSNRYLARDGAAHLQRFEIRIEQKRLQVGCISAGKLQCLDLDLEIAQRLVLREIEQHAMTLRAQHARMRKAELLGAQALRPDERSSCRKLEPVHAEIDKDRLGISLPVLGNGIRPVTPSFLPARERNVEASRQSVGCDAAALIVRDQLLHASLRTDVA